MNLMNRLKIDLQAWRAFSIFKFTKVKSHDKIKK